MALQLQCEDCEQFFIMADLGDVTSKCPYCGGQGVHEDPITFSKPAIGEQIGDHPGDKRCRNRQVRRAWSNGNKKIVPTTKYRGYD